MRVKEWRIAPVVLVVGSAGVIEGSLDLISLAGFGDSLRAQLFEQQHRVLMRLLPLLRIEGAE